MNKLYKKGLVIGKFLPPHKGHKYLFDFAKQYCEELTIVVDCIAGQEIDSEIRKQWIEEEITNVKVVALPNYMPQDPSETPIFWDIWRKALLEAANQPDVLIASMSYGNRLSEELNCKFIPVDFNRESINISATQIRGNIEKYWPYLFDSAKDYFVNKIALIGPESTGKSTIGASLALHFNTVYVPEYAKTIIDNQQGNISYENIMEFAYGHIFSIKSLSKFSNRTMFIDSDLITTIAWSEVLFKKVPNELLKLAKEQAIHHTFLFYPDTNWVKDSHRISNSNHQEQEFRISMFNRMEELLKEYNRKYTILHGDFLQKETQIINQLELKKLKHNGN